MRKGIGKQTFAIGLQRLGPAAIVKDARVRWERNVGIDERRAAEAAAHEDVQVGVDADVEHRGVRPQMPLWRIDLDVVGRVEKCVGILARVALEAALEQAHGTTCAGEP